MEAQWGDGLKGMRYQQARKALQELEKLDGQEHIKNWRPQVLLLVKPGVQSQTVAHPKLLGLLRRHPHPKPGPKPSPHPSPRPTPNPRSSSACSGS